MTTEITHADKAATETTVSTVPAEQPTDDETTTTGLGSGSESESGAGTGAGGGNLPQPLNWGKP